MTIFSAGTTAEIKWLNGDWIFLDIGFSSKGRTCGLLVGNGRPQCVTFANAKKEITDTIAKSSALNLVIEAPLSVCFDSSGNPTGRKIEIEGSQARYWYTGPGCTVMTATMYLLDGVRRANGNRLIRLFEGFVSYKSSKRSDHREDVLALRGVVRDQDSGSIYEADDLRRDKTDQLVSAFRVAGHDYGIPAVIKPSSVTAPARSLFPR